MDEKDPKEYIYISNNLKKLASIFKSAGFSLYLVGGGVRDFYLKRKNYDIDVATDARPEDVMRLFKKTIPTGIKHGTITIRFMGRNIECTTMRCDSQYKDGRHPDRVEYGASIIEDLARRDFTMNAIAAHLPFGEVIDPYNGREDIKKRLIRAVGSPIDRFEEDGLRPIRAIRFASQLGFAIEDATLSAIPHSLEKVKCVSIERFLDELNKMMCAKHFDLAFTLMKKLKIFQIFIPQLDTLEDEACHRLLEASGNIDEPTPLLRLCLICYWIYKENGQKIELVHSILKSLKYPNKVIDDVLHLVPYCDFEEAALYDSAHLRVFLKDAKKEYVQNIFILKKAIAKISPNNSESLKQLDAIEANIRSILEESPPLSIKELAIDGKDLLEIGIEKGPNIGRTLGYLLEIVLIEPTKNQKTILLELAKNYSSQNYATPF